MESKKQVRFEIVDETDPDWDYIPQALEFLSKIGI